MGDPCVTGRFPFLRIDNGDRAAIGAYADIHAAKKRLLLATTAGCVLGTAGLAAVGRG
jgi:hypothetical protein